MTSSLTPSSAGLSKCAKWLPTFAPLLAGGVSGTLLFVWIHQFIATFGVSLPVIAGLTMALSAGAALACWRHRRSLLIGRYAPAIAWMIVAVWTVVFPSLLGMATGATRWIPCTWLEVDATAFGILLIIASGLFIIPVAAMTLIGQSPSRDDQAQNSRGFPLSIRYLLGCGLALGAAPVLWTRWMTVEQIGFTFTAIAAVAFWVSLLHVADPQPIVSKNRTAPPGSFSGGWPQWIWIPALSLLIGMLIPVIQRVVMQFIPGCSYSHFALWSGMLCGIAGGIAWAIGLHRNRRGTVSRDGIMAAGLIVAVWPVVILLICPLLLEWNLSLNTNVTNVGLLTAIRWCMTFAALCPLGIAAGRAWSHSEETRNSRNRTALRGEAIICLAAGSVLMQSLWISPSTSILLLVFAAMALMTGRLWMLDRVVLSRRHWVGGTLAVAIVATLPILRHNHRPDLAAKLLFSSQTFAANRSGINRELLPHLDDGRLVKLLEGRDCTWTVWKHRGSQLLLRRNGIPSGVVSTHPSVCPQFAGDIMPAVIPLVVHPRPDRVLLVGLGSTATLSTCLACPVREVTCLEGDEDLIRINDEVIAAESGFNPLEDDRVELQTIDPTLALMADGDRYDVMILRDSQPYLLSQTSRFTREFYKQIDRRLNAGGVICQRFQYADFGRQPIENVLVTMRSVFPQVVCLESAPGEMLLLASNTKESLFDETLLKRCEASHVRRLLAQLGWDWSVVLNLAAISSQQIDELYAGDVQINTVGNGEFAYALPQEVMRCEPKWREVQSLMAQRGSRMLAWLGEEADVQAVSQRLADMTEQQRLIVEHPDHFWAYRNALKERLKERPRTKIVAIDRELQRALHPEDQRRKDYLETLGNAATESTPQPDDIERMTRFAEPYDPLVSYFLHQEAARLYERISTDDPTAEFDHLRYSVHFGPQQDRSVRNVIAALELLIDKPDMISDPQQRWDEMNALLDVLRQRSTLRVQNDRTASPFELVDAEKSIKIAERAMDAMDDLHAAAEVTTEDWEQRRTVLQRLLIRPMWTYHAKQAERLAALDARKIQTAQEDSSSQTK